MRGPPPFSCRQPAALNRASRSSGKSIMGLMMLAAEEGAALKIRADGPDESDVMTALDRLFSSRFDEKE
jgi:phosphocarrier protein HPr